MATVKWVGSTSDDSRVPGNWSTGAVPVTNDDVVFDGASDGNNHCAIKSAVFPEDGGDLNSITISKDFTKQLTTGLNTEVNLEGVLSIDKTACIKPAHTLTFDFNAAPSTTVYDDSGVSYPKKPFVVFGVSMTASAFDNDTARANTTFDFGTQDFTMIDGVYPNITGTGTLYAKSIYSDTSRSLHNTYGSVEMLAINGIAVVTQKSDIYDYDKEFTFEGALTAIGNTFNFGHTTARFKATGAANVLPVNGERNGNSYGNDTAKTFYAQYEKIIIDTPDNTSHYWKINAGKTLECNELVINDGGRLYGPATETRAATIKSVKRPTIQGDWNFRQVADGVYDSINDFSNTSVFEGGTGRQTLTDNAILYGQGMDQVGLLSLGSAGDVLAVNSGATGIEWSSTGGTNIELDELSDVTITSPTDLQVLIYEGTEWVNGFPEVKMIQVRNDEGITIPAGAPLYSRGEIGGSNRILVGIADANDSAKMPCIGIAYAEMNTTSTKDNYAVVSGVFNASLDGGFSGLSEGDIVYVKNWTGTPTSASDVLTTTRPTGGSEEVQNVGIILKTNGTIIQGLLVSAIGRSNDIPNATITTNSADADYVYIDDGNVWKKITPANLGIGGGSDTNTFVIVGEESDDYISASATAGNANGFQFSYGNGAQNTTKSSSGLDFGVMIPVACTLSRLDFTFGNIGNEDNTNNQTITVFKNATATTTTVTFNCNGSGGSAFTKSFSSLSGSGLSYSAGDRFNLRTTGLSGFSSAGTQIGPARMTAYFTVA